MASLAVPATAQVRITEFMASNTQTLLDEDGDSSDWIEIQNTSTNSVNLLNWALTDSAGNPGKWRFPATNIPPKSFMIVFASGKDRAMPGQELHTNFKLSADGEYLAMFGPDGSVATEITPQFPPQFPDVSYGIGMQLTTTTLVATNAAIHYLIPANASVDATWTQTNFNDSSWQVGTNGIGYETGIADPQEESFAAKVLATQPEAYWRLNETNGVTAVNLGSDGVSDGGGYVGGIVLGGAGPRPPSFPTFEANNNAPTFDGLSAYVNGPYELVNDLPAFTIGGWIYPTAAQNSRTGLFGQNDTMEFGFISSGQPSKSGRPSGSVSVNYPFPNNQWHHVMAVGGNGQISIYLDGVLAGTSSASEQTLASRNSILTSAAAAFLIRLEIISRARLTRSPSGSARWRRTKSPRCSPPMPIRSATPITSTPTCGRRCMAPTPPLMSASRSPVSSTNTFDSLQLLMRYDDGFRRLFERPSDRQRQCARVARVEFRRHAAAS